MTYSSYLLHVPLQLTVVTLSVYAGFRIPFYSPYFFLCYLAVILILSSLCYTHFEMPMQQWLRLRLMPRTSLSSRP